MNEQKINWRVVLAVALVAWLIAGRPGCNSTDDADPTTLAATHLVTVEDQSITWQQSAILSDLREHYNADDSINYRRYNTEEIDQDGNDLTARFASDELPHYWILAGDEIIADGSVESAEQVISEVEKLK